MDNYLISIVISLVTGLVSGLISSWIVSKKMSTIEAKKRVCDFWTKYAYDVFAECGLYIPNDVVENFIELGDYNG